jgi:hypothetical protein
MKCSIYFSPAMPGLLVATASTSASGGRGVASDTFPESLRLGDVGGGGGMVPSSKKALISTCDGSSSFRAATFASTLTGKTMACGGATVLELYDIVVWVAVKGFVRFDDWRWRGRRSFLWRGERCGRRRYGRVRCHWREKILFSGT